MSSVVLDASALLVVINQEPGWNHLTPALLSAAVSSTVNLSEVQGKLVARGANPDEAWAAAMAPIREAVPFTLEHSKLAGTLITYTRVLGLSLADRACLALAVVLKAPVYTADKAWKSLKLGIQINTVR